MQNKEAIIEATIALIHEKEDLIQDITMREISKKAGVGLGLINYHFDNKDKLIELCVQRIINGIIEKFRDIREHTKYNAPFEKLDYLGNMTLGFLFEHRAISKISMLSDMRFPYEADNTQRTIQAYLPLVASCRPDWDETKVRQMTECLVAGMQFAFLRHELLLKLQRIDLKDPQERKLFHTTMLENIIGRPTTESEVNIP